MGFYFVVVRFQVTQEHEVLMLGDINPNLKISFLANRYLEIDDNYHARLT